MKRRLATLALLASTTPLAAQWLTLSTPGIPRAANGAPDLTAPAPRAADGRPDLSGLWVPMEATGSLFDPNFAHDWARELMAERERRFYEDDPRFQCLPSGPGGLALLGAGNGMRRFVQTPNLLAVLNADLTYRQIFTDGRELESDPLPIWMGYSVGRWDGDTLVVESNGYNARTWLHRGGLSHTENLRMTERYRRPDFGHLELEVTYEDPEAFDGTLTANIEMVFAADNELLETVCAESSEPVTNWGGNISEAEQRVVEVAPEILARYVGAYEGYWLQRPIRVDVTLEDGVLFLQRTPPYQETALADGGKSQLIPLSDTTFECICGLGFVFTAEGDGMATEVSEVHVSGGWPFTRVD